MHVFRFLLHKGRLNQSFIKMTHFPRRKYRRSIRLKGYDYSRPGFYFITICVQNKKRLFGEILPGEPPLHAEMKLNDAGK